MLGYGTFKSNFSAVFEETALEIQVCKKDILDILSENCHIFS